jgi:4-diphosphocytidyl-2-C-methyl-D-erythritol kinase
MTESIDTIAHAKLNLGLCITGRRSDGFHDLISIFQTVSWPDMLRHVAAPDVSLTCSHPDLSTGTDNLVRRAADLVQRCFGIDTGARIHLEKTIPWGAGLGGGSSDAAAVLRGLSRLWNIDAPKAQWLELGAELGSDVPFFLCGGTALVTGRGEHVQQLTNIATDNLAFLVAVPPVSVSTPGAFRMLAEAATGTYPDASPYREAVTALRDRKIGMLEFCRALDGWNTFQSAVEERYPAIRDLRREIIGAGAEVALMSGSGSAVFGVFRSISNARKALESLGDEIVARVVRPVGSEVVS